MKSTQQHNKNKNKNKNNNNKNNNNTAISCSRSSASPRGTTGTDLRAPTPLRSRTGAAAPRSARCPSPLPRRCRRTAARSRPRCPPPPSRPPLPVLRPRSSRSSWRRGCRPSRPRQAAARAEALRRARSLRPAAVRLLRARHRADPGRQEGRRGTCRTARWHDVAARCTMLRAALCRSTLHDVAGCTVLQHVAARCSMLHEVALCCSMQHAARVGTYSLHEQGPWAGWAPDGAYWRPMQTVGCGTHLATRGAT